MCAFDHFISVLVDKDVYLWSIDKCSWAIVNNYWHKLSSQLQNIWVISLKQILWVYIIAETISQTITDLARSLLIG